MSLGAQSLNRPVSMMLRKRQPISLFYCCVNFTGITRVLNALSSVAHPHSSAFCA